MAWYEYPTNFSNGTEVNGFGDFILYISEVTNNYFGMGILILIWMMTFSVGMMSGSRKAILTSSFITFVFSIYFFRLGVINIIIPIFLIMLTIIGAIASKEENTY